VEPSSTLLVLGATGRTGRHLVSLALERGHRVRAVVRDPARLALRLPELARHPDLAVHRASVPDVPDLDDLVAGCAAVVCLLGDVGQQQHEQVNTAFVRQLVPVLRRHPGTRLLYQAGALSTPPDRRLPPALRAIRATLPRGFRGQHEDNEAVMRHLVREAPDLDWVVHRAGIGSDGPSRGVLERATGRPSVATFADCAAHDLRLLDDREALRTCDVSRYRPGPTPPASPARRLAPEPPGSAGSP